MRCSRLAAVLAAVVMVAAPAYYVANELDPVVLIVFNHRDEEVVVTYWYADDPTERSAGVVSARRQHALLHVDSPAGRPDPVRMHVVASSASSGRVFAESFSWPQRTRAWWWQELVNDNRNMYQRVDVR